MNNFEQSVIALATQDHQNIENENGMVFGKSTLPQNLYRFLVANGNSPDATDMLQAFSQYPSSDKEANGEKLLQQSTFRLLADRLAETLSEHQDGYTAFGVEPDTFQQVLKDFTAMLPTSLVQTSYAMMNGFHSKLGLSDYDSKEALTFYPSGSFTIETKHEPVSLLNEICKQSELAADMVHFVKEHLDCDAFDAVGRYRLPDNDEILQSFLSNVHRDNELSENPLKTLNDVILEHLCGNLEKAFESHICNENFVKDGQVLNGFEVLEQYDDFKPDIWVGADDGLVVNGRELKDLSSILNSLKGQFCSQMEVEPYCPKNNDQHVLKP